MVLEVAKGILDVGVPPLIIDYQVEADILFPWCFPRVRHCSSPVDLSGILAALFSNPISLSRLLV